MAVSEDRLTAPTFRGAWGWRRLLVGNSLLLVLLLIAVAGWIGSPYYFTAQNMENLLRGAAIFGLLALGMTPVLLTGRIDLSVAATMIFSVVLAVDLMIWLEPLLHGKKALVRGNTYNGDEALLIVLTLATGTLVGLLNGVGVALLRIPSFIMTLASMTALRGLSFVLTDGHPYYFKQPAFTWLANAAPLGIPFSMWVCLLLFGGLALLLGRGVAGRRIYAIGGHERTAGLAGIRVRSWIVAAYTLCGGFAAIAGLLFCARLGSVDAPLAPGYELTAIAVAVVGGTSLLGGRGSPYRTLLGALVLAGLLNLLNMLGVDTWYQNLITGLVLLFAVTLAEQGRRRSLGGP